MRGIRAVLFDLGGTLNDGEPGSETFCSILHAHGITRSINEVSAALKKVGSRLDAGKMAELGAKFWVEFDLSVLGELGIWENVSSLVEAIDREWWECARISLYPEALTVLKKLREEGLKIGVVTNSLQADLEKVLSKLGLKGFFDVEVSVDAAGKAKPAREIFIYEAHILAYATRRCHCGFLGVKLGLVFGQKPVRIEKIAWSQGV